MPTRKCRKDGPKGATGGSEFANRDGANGIQNFNGADLTKRGSYNKDGTPIDYAGSDVVYTAWLKR